MKNRFIMAITATCLALPVWSHDAAAQHDHAQANPSAPTHAQPAAPSLNAHTREDIARHLSMSRAHQEAAQCLAQGSAYDVCQKQLQISCKGLALGKNCGIRHSH